MMEIDVFSIVINALAFLAGAAIYWFICFVAGALYEDWRKDK